MSIQQTLVGLESTFGGRAAVLSHTISADNRLDENESSWLRLGSPFPLRSVRVHNRARSETQIQTDFIESAIQAALGEELPEGVRFNRNVSIGAMYTDDLPISGHTYSNIFVVVSFELIADIPLPRDAHILVEMYFGWRQSGESLSIADDWYLNVDVSDVGPRRKKKTRRKVARLLTNSAEGPSPGEQIRNGLREFFDQDNVINWYVIPGDGAHNSQENQVVVRNEAAFFVVTR